MLREELGGLILVDPTELGGLISTCHGLCDGGLTGVGADVAFNNRLDKGNWADLGKKIIVKDKERNNSRLVDKIIIKRMGIEKGKKGG